MPDRKQGDKDQDPNGQERNGKNPNGQGPKGKRPIDHTHDASRPVKNRMNAAQGPEFDDSFPPEKYKPFGENEWYFFTPRERKYKNGTRPNRAAGDGFWKATGADKPIKSDEVVVGFKKALVFYMGKPPRGDKTEWIMHEFRLEGPSRTRISGDDMKLDDWVLCKIYKKRGQDRSKLSSSRPSTSRRDYSISGQDDPQSDTEFQDNGAIDMGVEDSATLPNEIFMPHGPEGPRIIDMSGCYNQGGFLNSYDDTFIYHQSHFVNHNVPYSQGRVPEMPNYNVPYAQGRITGMANHNVPYSQGRLPRLAIHDVSDSQGRFPGMTNQNVSISVSQGKFPAIASYSYNNPLGQRSPWTQHIMIPTANQNPNQAAESSSAAARARPFQAYPHQHMFTTSNRNPNQPAESSSAVAARPFQTFPHQHMFATSNQSSNQVAESSSDAAARPFQALESDMKFEQLNECPPDDFLKDPSDDNCFDPDYHNSGKF
ncbi:hypothetical protein WN944_002829 [Citrus x changshan-huyou]|uniref:NAC domain-containing protein n=1 Tax=Citrus x changshan-huyou TaxID=2935761 RepID=A0AAP0QNT6_9ROSI